MPAQPNMDDILSEIRTSLAEETARAENGEPAPAAAGGFDVDLSDDEILALSDEDLVAEGAASPDISAKPSEAAGEKDLIDLHAFTGGKGLNKADAAAVAAAMGDDVLGEAVPEAEEVVPVETDAGEEAAAEVIQDGVAAAEDEMDKLLAEMKQAKAAPASAVNDALLAVEETPAAPVAEEGAEETPAEEQVEELSVEEAVAEVVPAALASAPSASAAPAGRVDLGLVKGARGLQVGLPSEILAEALRPLVKDWVEQNLPRIVEQLVSEEISKLTKQ